MIACKKQIVIEQYLMLPLLVAKNTFYINYIFIRVTEENTFGENIQQ